MSAVKPVLLYIDQYGIAHKFFEHCFLASFLFALPKHRTKTVLIVIFVLDINY
ncbi:MAG TPA: hypothetical protein VNO32_57250 [Candidatus Acidoferrum sp.]|jgi:hypothetical protein|nr:hypothetical protein [Candidatus Acidoferrum sp.]